MTYVFVLATSVCASASADWPSADQWERGAAMDYQSLVILAGKSSVTSRSPCGNALTSLMIPVPSVN